MSQETEILKLISDYETYRGFAQAAISPNHTYLKDLVAIVKMCDENLIKLSIKLKSIKEAENEILWSK